MAGKGRVGECLIFSTQPSVVLPFHTDLCPLQRFLANHFFILILIAWSQPLQTASSHQIL